MRSNACSTIDLVSIVATGPRSTSRGFNKCRGSPFCVSVRSNPQSHPRTDEAGDTKTFTVRILGVGAEGGLALDRVFRLGRSLAILRARDPLESTNPQESRVEPPYCPHLLTSQTCRCFGYGVKNRCIRVGNGAADLGSCACGCCGVLMLLPPPPPLGHALRPRRFVLTHAKLELRRDGAGRDDAKAAGTRYSTRVSLISRLAAGAAI
jgi:hypothetical protein